MPPRRPGATVGETNREEERRVSTPAGVQRLRATRGERLMLVVNPRASGVTPALVEAVERAARAFGARRSTLVTESPREWLDALDGDPACLVLLLGGDGTLHAAVNESELRPTVALVPAGRANNVARSLGIPLRPDAAVRLALEGQVKPIDLVRAATPSARHVTVEAVSVGFLAQARARYHAANSAHVASALAAGMHALAEFHPLRVRLATPMFERELTLAQLFVANLPLYAFGLHVAPEAELTDGLLDVVAIEGHGRTGIPPMLHRLATDTGRSARGVHRWRVPWARIDVVGGSPVVSDSVDLGPGPLEVDVLPENLRIVRP